MASPVYTVLLGEGIAPTGFSEIVFGPPAGFRYVVTDVDATETSSVAPAALSGFTLSTGGNGIVWMLGTFAFRQQQYHWRGRQVIDVGDDLFCFTGDSGWHFRVTGFQLTLP